MFPLPPHIACPSHLSGPSFFLPSFLPGWFCATFGLGGVCAPREALPRPLAAAAAASSAGPTRPARPPRNSSSESGLRELTFGGAPLGDKVKFARWAQLRHSFAAFEEPLSTINLLAVLR